ncbi:hypothetical protein GOODEAATRI_032942 [Goodea atripinnis]|uniref:Uncharacterized protein n=1 Tax=Goodea atripinnis TaxID=208336 RepID=A0ABV0NZU4_9TELE
MVQLLFSPRLKADMDSQVRLNTQLNVNDQTWTLPDICLPTLYSLLHGALSSQSGSWLHAKRVTVSREQLIHCVSGTSSLTFHSFTEQHCTALKLCFITDSSCRNLTVILPAPCNQSQTCWAAVFDG